MLLAHETCPSTGGCASSSAARAGLRDGEIAALQWQDADLDAPVPCLHVRKARALVREKDEQTGPTKNAGSNRDVPIHPLAVKALRMWKGRGWVEWVGRHAQTHDFVFPSEKGEVWRPRSAETLRALLLAAGCEATFAGKPIDFHALRRSFATWLARAGVERVPHPPRPDTRQGHSAAAQGQRARGAHVSGASRPSKKALLAVARFAGVFSAPGFSAGQWVSGPYFKASAAVSEFVHAVYEHGIIPKDFNWTDWVSVGELLEADTARLPSADLETVRRLLTCH
jgi:hypothetical protein